MKATFHTFGCRLNQSETAIIARSLQDYGYEVSGGGDNADLCVINTCTVTNQSDAKCRQSIRAIQRKNPNAIIAVVGCYSQMASDQIKDIGGIDLILGTEEKLNLHRYLPQIEKADDTIIAAGPISKGSFIIETESAPETTRANLKVQDGCNFICSFCIIPFARGRSRAREFEDIRKEALQLARMGFRELVLTGVNLGTYALGDYDFLAVVKMLDEIPGIERIRISSIEPTTVPHELFSMMKDPNSKLLPYLHLPLQSASNPVLKAMRRRYTYEEYRDFVAEATDLVPNLCVGSDLLVGFPGETEELFEETFQHVKEMPLHYFHVFPYSERKGTYSVKMPDKVPGNVIADRALRLRELSDQKKENFAKSFLDQEVKVLFEEQQGNSCLGYSENYIRVSALSPVSLKNQIHSVKLSCVGNGMAEGVLLS